MVVKPIVSPTQKTRALIAGVDTLIVNAKQVDVGNEVREEQTLPEGMEACLKDWRELARCNEEPYVTPWEHEHIKLKMWHKDAPGWAWLLKNGFIDLMIGAQLNKGTLARVRFSSEYLWKCGPLAALKNTDAFLARLFGETLLLQPAEIHLCTDVVGLTIPKDYERVFVSRARVHRPIRESFLDRPVYRHGKLETLEFGKHVNPLSASIYDKTQEIKIKSPQKIWFHDLWKAQGWDGSAKIWRDECRLKRECLHEMDIEEAYDALEKVPALWAYCVGHVGEQDGWLRMVKPDKQDKNRWRWETSDAWKEIQQAFAHGWNGYEDMTDVQRERKREINMEQAEAAIAGYLTTYGAWDTEISPHDDVSVVMQKLHDQILERWEKKGVDFQYLRRQKQFDYHIS